MDNRDEIIRSQMETISNLINNNLKNLAEELYGPQPKRKEENEENGKIIKFPGKYYSD